MFIALPFFVLTAPVWVVGVVVWDLASGYRRLPTLRLGAMGLVYLCYQIAAISLFLGVTIWGTLTRSRNRRSRYHRIQVWWSTALLGWAGRLCGLKWDWSTKPLPSGGFVLAARHASMIDAILPIVLCGSLLDNDIHYVLKQELLWDPAIGIYGPKLDNHFTYRGGNTNTDTNAIQAMVNRAAEDAVMVIFPEGTYSTPQRRARVRASLVERGSNELVELADSLDHLLPPRPLGMLTMLNELPEYDVVIVGHVGLEGIADFSGLRKRIPLQSPVKVRWWHKERQELPSNKADLVDWLNQEWLVLDRWVGQQLAQRQDTVEHL